MKRMSLFYLAKFTNDNLDVAKEYLEIYQTEGDFLCFIICQDKDDVW